jgi:hypothetical protein
MAFLISAGEDPAVNARDRDETRFWSAVLEELQQNPPGRDEA